MNQLQEFHKPGKAYKQVKAEKLRLADRAGADVQHSVMVYMSTAGTPHFAIGVPEDYVNAWERHRSHEHKLSRHRDVYILDRMVKTASYDAVVEIIKGLSDNFQRHIRNIAMKKVIRVAMEIKSTEARNSHNAPSFSKSRVLVGIRSGIYWEVNGSFYSWDGSRKDGRWPFGHDDLPDEDPGEPKYADLRPGHMDGNPITIPFTPAAWETVQQVEQMLERAAAMLLQLTNAQQAQALLEGGLQKLTALAAPAPEVAE